MKVLHTKIQLVAILLVAIFLNSGCKPDEEITPPGTFSGAQVLIANQGNFGWGEGTLSVYYEGSKSVDNEVYKEKNNESLGNVFQSISRVGNKYYFVINNSGRLVVTDTNFVKIDVVNDFTSPRYFYQTDENKGYMTDLYSDHIYLMDLESNASVATLENGHWSERGVIAKNKFWYTAPATDKIFSLDIESDLFQDSIVVGEKPESIVKDKDGTIWVLCKGDDSKNESAKLTAVTFDGGNVSTISIDLSGVPTSLAYDEKNHTLYFLSDRIWRFRPGLDTEPIAWKQLPDAVLYAAAVNPNTSDLYVADIKDYVSKSTIYRYSYDGELLDEFSAGIIAGDFFFP